MVDLSTVLKQLSDVGYRVGIFQKAEVKELQNVLHDGEMISQATNGYYEGGMGLLVATDTRLILIDHKPMFLTLDSIAYSMISEVTFNYRLFNSTIHIFTSNKVLDFHTWNHGQIREILSHIQRSMRREAAQRAGEVSTPDPAFPMSYEQLSVPEMDVLTVPTMPAPSLPTHFANNRPESEYVVSSPIDTMDVRPNDLRTEVSNPPAYTPANLSRGRYMRRSF